MFGFMKKKPAETEATVEVKEVSEPEEKFAPIYHDSTVTSRYFYNESELDEPDCPDWYSHKWEIVIRGEVFSIRYDGLFVADCSYYRGRSYAHFRDISEARKIMYVLIRIDIGEKDMARRDGEVVEAWP